MTKVWGSANYKEDFATRHIGPGDESLQSMAKEIGYDSMNKLIDTVVPKSIRFSGELDLKEPASEKEATEELRNMMQKNKLFKSFIGTGYYDTITPSVVQRNILENPGWYTQYTPYQSEIAQGRLEALLNFQTMVIDLTGFDIANASLLDEGTAAAEAMYICFSSKKKSQSNRFIISNKCHPQTIAVVQTRADALGIEISIQEESQFDFSDEPLGVLLQYPDTEGNVLDYGQIVDAAHQNKSMVVMAADLLSLCRLKSPGEWGADIAVGTTQRFGVPLGYGGPHAGYISTKDSYKRKMPGRIVGVSIDTNGKKAYRLALATREQHIRRDKATSNICTAQVLLAIISSMYAVYHGPKGLKKIANKVHDLTRLFKANLENNDFSVPNKHFFDTLKVETGDKTEKIYQRALDQQINLRKLSNSAVTLSFDETTSISDLKKLITVFTGSNTALEDLDCKEVITKDFERKTTFLTHPNFNSYGSETEMMRYIKKLELRDLSLAKSMIPLGSCTMKLNAATELMPITWPSINSLHPFVPVDQAEGYSELLKQLEGWLSEVTGFDACSLQPNSGAQGEFAGLMVIKRYLEAKGESNRNICLIPSSAHGTNPASATIAGMKVVVVKCDDEGNIHQEDLKAKAEKHKDNLAALMVTYPSTHGVFEEGFSEICELVHINGGQVYMDGANLQAQLTLCKAGKLGPDVCHLNLHKTFCIPHGGGGPGVGPIAVKSHLADYLPSHPVIKVGGKDSFGPVSAAPYGSPSILPISWMYIRMMGYQGLAQATKAAIVNANYIAKRLKSYYPIVYTGNEQLVAHECIIDLRSLKKSSGVEENDVAKRLMDYGFHAPTVSWPVAGTLMIEPTESESKEELDRFCDAMISIAGEVKEIEEGKMPKDNNLLKNAPHTAEIVSHDQWDKPYPRERAAYPLAWVRDYKFWPYVSRIDNAYGDRHLVCSCPPLEQYES